MFSGFQEQTQHFPGAGNTLGTRKIIVDAENSLPQVPGSFGCTCTTSQAPPKREGRNSCCPQGSVHKNGVFLLILNSFALSEVWIQISPVWRPQGLEKAPCQSSGGFRLSCFPGLLGKIHLKQPKSWEGLVSAGTETRKTSTSTGRCKHRELQLAKIQSNLTPDELQPPGSPAAPGQYWICSRFLGGLEEQQSLEVPEMFHSQDFCAHSQLQTPRGEPQTVD